MSDGARPTRPTVSHLFLGLCVLLTLTSIVVPSTRGMLGGIAPRRYPWQPLTAVFVHGWAGVPAVVHLALNALLIVTCGPPTERLLGRKRFGLLCAAAAAGNAVVLAQTDGANGASLVIWSWGPPLMLALGYAARSDPTVRHDPAWRRLRDLLIIMYVVVTPAMTALPYLAGWRGSPAVALARANVFHFTATGVGALFALAWRRTVERRITAPGGWRP